MPVIVSPAPRLDAKVAAELPARLRSRRSLAEHAQRILVFVAIILVAYFGVRVMKQATQGIGGDWGVYYRAGHAFIERGPLYTLDQGAFLTFKYAPIVAMASAPWALLPPVVARLLWLLIDVACLALLCRAAWQLLPGLPSAQRDARAGVRFWIVAAALALVARYAMNQWHSGSTATAWIAMTAAACVALRDGRARTAGVLLAAATMWKLVPICFLPLLALDSRRRAAVGSYAVGLVVMGLLPALWLGWELNAALLLEWPLHLNDTELPAQVWRIQNQSIYALLARLLSDTPLGVDFADWSLEQVRVLWLAVSVASAGALYGWIAWQRRRATFACDAAVVSLLLIYMTLFNPLAWRYNFVALVVPYIVALDGAWRLPRRRATILALVVVGWALGSLPAEGSGWPGVDTLHALGARFWGTCLLAVAVLASISRPVEIATDEAYEVIGPLRLDRAVSRREAGEVAEAEEAATTPS